MTRLMVLLYNIFMFLFSSQSDTLINSVSRVSAQWLHFWYTLTGRSVVMSTGEPRTILVGIHYEAVGAASKAAQRQVLRMS